ncbi:MAG: DUF1501 domain-containing protein [Verrucomicrobiota bacterium]
MDSEQRADCGSPEHGVHRRRFLEGMTAGAISTFSWAGLFNNSAFAETAKRSQKRCILLWLCGGPSQFETWDPKPGVPTSGPFKSIPTAIPGVHFSELMPKYASIADKVAVVRSMKTTAREHTQGINLLQRGHKPRPPFTRPTLGSVVAQQLGHVGSALPNFILLDPCPEGNEFKGFKAGNWGGWLGAEYGPVRVGGEFQIPHVDRIDSITEDDHEAREELRKFFSKKFENDTKSEAAASHNAVFERVKGLMSCAHLFDLERLPRKDRERYGPGTFGQHTLLARTLVEEGAPFVMVANGMPWDTHVFSHEIYQMVTPDLDNILFQLHRDLEERGMLEDTLVVAMGEFGRTPNINPARGRDHYPDAWSMTMFGSGIQPGAVVGATDEYGIDVIEKPFDEQNLFATIFNALGIDPYAEFAVDNIPTFHHVEDKSEPIREVLA